MTGNRVPLFRRARVVKKSSKEPGVSTGSVFQPAAAQTSISVSEKRPALIETRPKLFSKRQNSIAHKVFDELPRLASSGFQITEASNLWKKLDAFCASHPLLLEWIGKDYESIKDPLEVHGALTRHLIRIIPSSLLSFFLSPWVKELKEDNERLKVASTIAIKEKKEETAQAFAEIKKHDALQARFTRLEGERFDISQKLERLQLVHNHATKKVGELQQRAKVAEEALPQRIQEAIYDYERSEEFHVEAVKKQLTAFVAVPRHKGM
ncbi:hypothetical protein LIER_31289 [Lithospermum erythrorhizon]|uniref:Uncharacterized protein n=1 Tax=Lithospermum erythrorhizon TaxID=34254 RepID=A0AAV3RQF6_LITER